MIIKKFGLSGPVQKATLNFVFRVCLLTILIIRPVLRDGDVFTITLAGPALIAVMVLLFILYKIEVNRAKKGLNNLPSKPT